MTVRRLVRAGTAAALVLFAAAGPLAGVGRAQSSDTAPPSGTIGIRLMDAPASRADDPRARLYIVDHLAPGTTIARRVEVSNDTDTSRTVQLYPAAATVSGGIFQFGEGRAVNELTTWTTVEPSVLTLAPGAKGIATTTIKVDPKPSPGERYAVVWAEVGAPAPPGGGITTVNRVGIRVYLSVGPGGEPPSDFVITALQPQRAADGSPMVAATVRNSGGRALDLSGELKLSNGPGALAAGPFPAKLGTTLGIGQTEPVLVTLDRAIPDGPWDAEMLLREGMLERRATGRITFPRESAPTEPVANTSGRSGPPPAAIGAIGAAALAAAAFVPIRRLRLRRRRDAEESPG